MTPIYIVLGIVVLIVLWLIFAFNRLVSLRNQTQEALSDIDVQSKRRYTLIPNLVETVKGYAAHEKNLLENVTAARAAIMTGGKSPLDRAKAEDQFSAAIKSIFAVAENYPQLKANENFLDLQKELTDTEDKMMSARRFYNGSVRDLNTAIQKFPTNLIAGPFGFSQMKFFELSSPAEGQPVQVKF